MVSFNVCLFVSFYYKLFLWDLPLNIKPFFLRKDPMETIYKHLQMHIETYKLRMKIDSNSIKNVGSKMSPNPMEILSFSGIFSNAMDTP